MGLGAGDKTPFFTKQWFLDAAEVIDAWRLFPRIFNGVLLWLLIDMHLWFRELEGVKFPEFYVIVVWGAITIVNKFYMGTARKWA